MANIRWRIVTIASAAMVLRRDSPEPSITCQASRAMPHASIRTRIPSMAASLVGKMPGAAFSRITASPYKLMLSLRSGCAISASGRERCV